MSTGTNQTQWLDYYRELEKPLYNTVYRWLWDAAESQDVVQEAFLKCWQRRNQIDSVRFKPFLFRTALNLASNRRRSNKLWRWVSLDALIHHQDQPDVTLDTLGRELQQAIDSLPNGLKQVLVLNELAGMDYQEIAAVLGIKVGTVGSRRNRALAKLRTQLASAGVAWNED
jgi:RNA polymerase sigma-70 factor (ECF subfamily)